MVISSALPVPAVERPTRRPVFRFPIRDKARLPVAIFAISSTGISKAARVRNEGKVAVLPLAGPAKTTLGD